MADILPAQVDRTLESNEAVIIALAICIMDEAKGSPEEIDRVSSVFCLCRMNTPLLTSLHFNVGIFDELPHHPENQSTDPPENVQ
ncbi:hypothetical protein Pst134EA_022755 [Puccinia striiformis f. sp. tritici]|uniref:hypothetical protein n=1 Tax=Puccinia striiformis f. sp. tritici TaxID=168172 RepID=UPI0020084ADE|nr:hypothetical protein Pst134EA_022755 [Puccinia striiformis f. sp. tritici]KAH9455281.1 hypothetical protein Pst134EA_022755 [Puccinia striiformis f. sp. tritici]